MSATPLDELSMTLDELVQRGTVKVTRNGAVAEVIGPEGLERWEPIGPMNSLGWRPMVYRKVGTFADTKPKPNLKPLRLVGPDGEASKP
jgi:hypothetical protein